MDARPSESDCEKLNKPGPRAPPHAFPRDIAMQGARVGEKWQLDVLPKPTLFEQHSVGLPTTVMALHQKTPKGRARSASDGDAAVSGDVRGTVC